MRVLLVLRLRIGALVVRTVLLSPERRSGCREEAHTAASRRDVAPSWCLLGRVAKGKKAPRGWGLVTFLKKLRTWWVPVTGVLNGLVASEDRMPHHACVCSFCETPRQDSGGVF
mmetsp:Transcript_27347/g.109517  ORF Transcript_27347/g.109517 Transcript_27347/m.109517 type:complete len:114 (+) Transcript_27347:743-1084(+)